MSGPRECTKKYKKKPVKRECLKCGKTFKTDPAFWTCPGCRENNKDLNDTTFSFVVCAE
jgi:Zn finger protein HypA/HybF involved in hydrogenase expression